MISSAGAAASHTTADNLIPKSRAPQSAMRLSLRLQHVPQNFAALLRLPDLIRRLSLLQRKELSVCIERRPQLMQLIVTERADKPGSGPGRFHFGNDLQRAQRRRAIAR